jgi:hypothetical protein
MGGRTAATAIPRTLFQVIASHDLAPEITFAAESDVTPASRSM